LGRWIDGAIALSQNWMLSVAHFLGRKEAFGDQLLKAALRFGKIAGPGFVELDGGMTRRVHDDVTCHVVLMNPPMVQPPAPTKRSHEGASRYRARLRQIRAASHSRRNLSSHERARESIIGSLHPSLRLFGPTPENRDLQR